MGDNELLIKINADVKGVTKAYEDVQSKTEDLDETLSKIGKVSAVAFAALTATVVTSLHAFEESEAASRELTQALQNQGIFTEELRKKYEGYATSLQRTTGIEDDQIVRAQAVAQAFLGQIPITERLTKAITDLSVGGHMPLAAAAEAVGKAINNGTGSLIREGLQLSKTSTDMERHADVLSFVEMKYGNQAEAANKGVGAIKGLTAAMNDQAEELGKRFAPAAEWAIKLLTDLFTVNKKSNPAWTDIKASVITLGLALSGLGVAIPLLIKGWLALRAVFTASAVALGITSGGLLLIIGIVAAVVTGIVLLGDKWKQIFAGIAAYSVAWFNDIKAIFTGIAIILSKPFDPAEWKRAVTMVVDTVKKGGEDMAAAWTKAGEETKAATETQTKVQKDAAEEQARLRREHNRLVQEIASTQSEYLLMQEKGYSADSITLKKEELELLKQIEQEKDKVILGSLKKRLANNLAEQEKFGVQWLALQQILHSKEVAKVKEGTGELVALQNSRNATLKTIGKIAAIAQILISTAESAAKAFAALAWIPIVGIGLGIAAAGAITAYGAERIATVTGAEQGGIVKGSGYGDRVPFMLEPGELIAPRQNFDEVVNAVARERSSDGATSSGGSVKVMIGFDGRDAQQVLTARRIEDEALGVQRAR